MNRTQSVVTAVLSFLAAVAVVVALIVTNHPKPSPPGPPPTSATPETPTTPGIPPGPVLAVKVDNVADARPQTGLCAADVVYVEPVEGGLTRLVAVYAGHPPPVVGPVRSARQTDVELLAQYGRPTLAYSGAAPEILPLLHGASLVNASPAETPGAYYRAGPHPVPHNDYVRPAALPPGSGRTVPQVLTFGPAPSGGQPVGTVQARYPAAGYRFDWSGGRWLVGVDGAPFVSTDCGQLGVPTVVEQQVAVHAGAVERDAAGNFSPVAETVGTGPATVLRDGQSFAANWSRPDPNAGTTFSTVDGRPLPLAPGPVWILLLPR